MRWLRWDELSSHLPGLVVLVGMAAVFYAYSVPLPGRATVSVTGLVALLSISAYGPSAGLLVVPLGTAFAFFFSRRPWYKTCFDVAQFALSASLAGVAYGLAGGLAGEAVRLRFLGPYYAMAGTYLVVNSLLLSLLFFTLDGQAPWRYWWSIVSTSWLNVVASLFAGIFLQAVYTSLNLAGVVFIFALLLGVRYTFKLFADAQNFYLEIVRVLIRVLEFKDPFTSGHSERVAQLSELIGREMGFVDRSLELLKNSALMHDIGKVAVPDAILVKPGPLTAAERVQMDLHVEAGDLILSDAPHLQRVSDFVAGHHEHFNGGGYPRHMAGEEIPLASRIIAAADAFDAMATDRPYRSALPLSEVMMRLQEAAGGQFDPAVLAVLFRLKGYDPETGVLAGTLGGWAVPAFRPTLRRRSLGSRAAVPRPIVAAGATPDEVAGRPAPRDPAGAGRRRRPRAS